METKLNVISNPSIKGVFTKWIKQDLKKWLKNKKTLKYRAFYLSYVDDFNYSIDVGVSPKISKDELEKVGLDKEYVCGTDPFIKDGVLKDLLNDAKLLTLQELSDKAIAKYANLLIDEYNLTVTLAK